MIETVTVEKDGIEYVCRPEHNTLRCGKCLRGRLISKKGEIQPKCLVCNAQLKRMRRVIGSDRQYVKIQETIW